MKDQKQDVVFGILQEMLRNSPDDVGRSGGRHVHCADCQEPYELPATPPAGPVSPFDAWLKTVCFQKPTPEAYDLARQAWNAAKLK